nr:MepB family protein [Microbacterium amylolyticum]
MNVAVTPEEQNTDYEAGIAQIGGEDWHIRTARNTPSKPGAFVAFWRRDADGVTAPFAEDDQAAGLLVFVNRQDRRGVFRFTGRHLADLRITSGKRPGKRGFRVYPTWCEDLNAAATATQRAQALAFQELGVQGGSPRP